MALYRVPHSDILPETRALESSQLKVMRARSRLKYEHSVLTELLTKYENLGAEAAAAKTALFQEIKLELRLHTRVEEEVFYPELQGEPDVLSKDIVAKGRKAHKTLRILLDEMSALQPGDPAFEAKMKDLKESFLDHAAEQEGRLFRHFSTLAREIQENLSAAERSGKRR